MAPAGVWACIVCWRASAADIRARVDAIAPQVGRVVVVDNAADPAVRDALPAGVAYLPMASNVGTAGAVNHAWALAAREGAEGLLTLDQDSTPEPDMVARLVEGLRRLQSQGVRVGAVGPMKVDPRNRRPGRLLKPVRFLRHFETDTSQPVVEVDHLIASGCLMPASALRAVGGFDEALFLDYVDIDWCLRARAQGLRHFCVTGARLSHTIGDQVVDVGSRTLSLHAPLRTYLVVRNHLLLWRKPAIRRLWLASDGLQVIKKALGLLLLAPRKAQRLRAIGRGLADGLQGRGGAP
jgi:rhamnosyltransferase